MSQSLVTIIGKVLPENFERARDLAESLGNPASPSVSAAFEAIARQGSGLEVHFSSINVFPASSGGGHLVFEFSAEGDRDALIAALATDLGPQVEPLFALAADRGRDSLGAYWRSHVAPVGQGFFANPGVVFSGTPGLSVSRIRAERDLRSFLDLAVDEEAPRHDSALSILAAIRAKLPDAGFAWALTPEDAAALHTERSILQALRRIAPTLFGLYLWPLTLPTLVTFFVMLARNFTLAGFGAAVMGAISALVGTAVVVAVVAAIAYFAFRRRENADTPNDRAPNPTVVQRIVERENYAAQNHLAAVSRMKPGLLRRAALKLVFAAIAQLATHLYRPGWLGSLGTIHFARWVMVPGTNDLLFLSNYGGSWESYLEDFITKAHNGLTAVWSNTEDFPRTANLIQLGASDADRFKRWARRQQVPTACWYSAYPDVTTAVIRANAAMRQGLGTILTEEEARRWLALFGSQPRPPSAMQVNEIQSLTFGGLGFLRYGRCIAFELGQDQEQARAWLREMNREVAFGDGRKHEGHAIILALGAGGLAKLGLPQQSLDTFPPAFLEGMASPSRARILGDVGQNAPDQWEWGGPGQRPVDGVVMLYASSKDAMKSIRDGVKHALESRGHAMCVEVPFVTLPDKREAPAHEVEQAKLEPFGFVDGVSQPVIRGTYKSYRGADSIHLVEPGEFILGYPDNRGTLPATPTLSAMLDPNNVLPIAAAPQFGFADPIVNDLRDIGRNGTFLAVRQLEQDVKGFWGYCADAAAVVRQRFPTWNNVTSVFIGAKLVGRWPDGSSLVRYPYAAGSESSGDAHPMVRPGVGAVLLRRQKQSPPSPGAAKAVQQAEAPSTPRHVVEVKRTDAPTRPVAVTPDNDFLFGAEDPQGLRCPFGAHIRRANPRDSFDAASLEQLAITNRHRVLRVGRRYEPAERRDPGLFFMCLNADLERQFEFVQQTWLQSPNFGALNHERDPLIGSRNPNGQLTDDGFTIPTREAPVRLQSMPEFVRTLGGGYFFVPGRSFLRYLGGSTH